MSWLQEPFDSLLIHFWYICVLTKREVQMARYWQSSFFFSFLRFHGLWQVKVQKNAKKRNDANIQLSWLNEQYEFDIIRIKKWLVYFEKRERNRSVEKDFCSSCHERGTEKKILSPHEESNLRPSDTALRCSNHWATENPRWARGLLRSSYDTRPTYC